MEKQKRKKVEDFTIKVEMSDEPEHIKEQNYNEFKKYIVHILNNIEEYKDNKVPV